MKRRLDLALALVHRPRMLFLDEPTTGLDPQSRTALWEEVGRLANEDGVTVFLTTQYLEEADVLADRVGIIDHGHIVAEGTPARAQGGDRPPDGRGGAGDEPTTAARSRACSRGSASRAAATPARRRARCEQGDSELADVVRALDAEGIAVAELELHAPTLDDVFLAKTGRSLEGAGEDEDATRAEAAAVSAVAAQVGALARRSVVRTLPPARERRLPPLVFPLLLLAVNAGGLAPRRACPASRPTRSSPSRSRSRSSRARSSRR